MGFFSCGFKFVRVDFGASKELIETRQEGKCEEKSFFEKASLVVASLVVVCLRGFAGKMAGSQTVSTRARAH